MREDPRKIAFETQIIKSEKIRIWASHYNATGKKLNLNEIEVDLKKLKPFFEKYQALSPIDTWKKNKNRSDLRNYTREFEKFFSCKEKTEILPGNVYASTYAGNGLLTDKHHVTPLFLSFGRFRDDEGKIYTRGINLLYLRPERRLEILEEASKHCNKKPVNRVSPIIKIHEKWMKIAPYAFKNFEDSRIVGLREIENFDWGMIPLLQTNLIGNFNPIALNEDFLLENVQPKPVVKKKKKKAEKTIAPEYDETLESYDILDAEFIDEEDIEDIT